MTNKYSEISFEIVYVGCDDLDLDLFEGQYVIPEGVAYNSYVILDEQTCVMDTVDARKTDEWMENVAKALDGRTPAYLVVQHCEPDHSSSVITFVEKYPDCKIVCSAKALQFLEQFFTEYDLRTRAIIIKEGDTLSLGSHTLHFIAAPLVHWPEVMMTYEESEHVLFAADGFGKFGALCNETDDWACEARRYYFNICGKYGAQVQAVLKKAAALQIDTICPLHGPVLKENLGYYIGLYDTWSSYRAETDGVFVAYCSMHGNTAKAAQSLVEMLQAKGLKVADSDLSRCDMAEAIEDAFRYDRMVLCAPTYDGGVMPVMSDFIHHLAIKNYQNRTVALVENGTWGPQAARVMAEQLEKMKNVTIVDQRVTIRSAVKQADIDSLQSLADAIANS